MGFVVALVAVRLYPDLRGEPLDLYCGRGLGGLTCEEATGILAVVARVAEEGGVEGGSGVYLGRLDDVLADEGGCEG